MALSWWDVGTPPDTVAWCEKNVQEACQKIADESTPIMEATEHGFTLKVLNMFWEEEIGEATTLADLIHLATGDEIEGAEGPWKHPFDPKVLASLRAAHEHIGGILAKYDK